MQTCKLEQVVHYSKNMLSKRTAEKKSIIPKIEKIMSQRKMPTANYERLKSSLNSQESKHTSYNNKKKSGRTPSSKRTDEISNDLVEKTINS